MSVYYNECDPFAAAWLRELITAGALPDGEVDERSIVDVRPDDVCGFRQCHFFAGIGGWPYALQLAGWGDGPVWTGSCPCQPFSAAGSQAGGDDSRDLWPVWFQLIRECRPAVVFGEQVDAAIAHGWLDRLCDDLEAEEYAIGACVLPAASVGAFHLRHRLWFVADTENTHGRAGKRGTETGAGTDAERRRRSAGGGTLDLDDTIGAGLEGFAGDGDDWDQSGRQRADAGGSVATAGPSDGELGDTGRTGLSEQRGERRISGQPVDASTRQTPERADASTHWSDVVWLPCRDRKSRPTQPGLQPLAHGVPNRVGRLRGYGNAIVPQVAQAFIEAYLDTVTA